MKMAVCIKRVPDTAAKIRIHADEKSIDPADLSYIMSPYDEIAVEEALQIKQGLGEGSVTVICVGEEVAQQNVRQGLAMGADDGILVKSDHNTLDAYSIAKNLAEVLKDRGDELIFFGRQSVDAQSGQVGPMVARMLGLPCVSDVSKFELDGKTAKIEREIEGGREVLEAQLPLVVTTQKGLNEPRYASLKGIMAAKKKPIANQDAIAVESPMQIDQLSLPEEREAGKIVGEGVEAVAELVKLLRDEAKVL